jgi:hypothetical protein
MPWTIFRQRGDEVAGGWRKLHNEKVHNYNLYSSPSIIRKIKQMRIRKAEHVARMEGQDICGKTRRRKTIRKTKT